MLSLSSSTGYAIKALNALPNPGGKSLAAEAVAERADVPGPYLAKLVQRLVEAGLVTSKQGRSGGLLLAKDPSDITILEIASAVEATPRFDRCLMGLSQCSDDRPCPAHNFWKGQRAGVESWLRTTTLADFRKHEKRFENPLAAYRR